MYMHASQVGQHFNLRPNFELWKRRHYPIIPTGMRYNIKGPWQPGHQCESFHWFIIYTVSVHQLQGKAIGYLTQAWKQTSGDPSGQTLNYRGITLLYNFTTALLYMVLSVTVARIVTMLLNIY